MYGALRDTYSPSPLCLLMDVRTPGHKNELLDVRTPEYKNLWTLEPFMYEAMEVRILEHKNAE